MLVYIEQRQKYFEKEMGRTLEGLKFSYLRLGNVHLCTICQNYVPGSWSLKI